MGTFYEKIILSNSKDDVRVACGLLDEPRTVTLDALIAVGDNKIISSRTPTEGRPAIPDTGAWTL